MMKNEELEDITEVEEAKKSGSAGALVAGVVGGFLAYIMVSGVRRLWDSVGAKLAEYKVAKKAKTEVADMECTEAAVEDSDRGDSER